MLFWRNQVNIQHRLASYYTATQIIFLTQTWNICNTTIFSFCRLQTNSLQQIATPKMNINLSEMHFFYDQQPSLHCIAVCMLKFTNINF